MGQTLTDIKNRVMAEILKNQNILKALIIDSPDFLTHSPSTAQKSLLSNPQRLIRKQIFPYVKTMMPTTEDIPYITTRFVSFTKTKMQYRNGIVFFYVLIPMCFENTDYGIRYDFILDELEKTFCNSGIGDLEVGSRNDIEFADKCNYIGGCVSFKVIDFYGVK